MEVSLFNDFSIYGDKHAIIGRDFHVSYQRLEDAVRQRAHLFAPKSLIAIENRTCFDTFPHLITYFACLRANACAMMLPATINKAMIVAFIPDVVVTGAGRVVHSPQSYNVAPTVMLSTSGTTSSGKFVKLSRQNIQSNCDAIKHSLPIQDTDVACLLLSPTYSYGLSVINTHLSTGAALYVPTARTIGRAFWQEVSNAQITSLAMVPSHLEVLNTQQFEKHLPSSLAYVTVAGGRVTDIGYDVLKRFRMMGIKTFVMYGQTEATARITCLPDRDFDHRIKSVGRAIAGTLEIDQETGEVLYTGPNVFGGYAESRGDLVEMSTNTTLRTGDLGRLEDGYLWITGRLKRMAKINSQRVSLDELEQQLEAHSSTVVKCVSDDVFIYAFSSGSVKTDVSSLGTKIKLIHIDAIPLLPNGKTNYRLLETLMINESH
jgi:long-chain acyl-CoA synthetase